MDGILNINKPLGPTSHDVVAQLRRTLRPRKIGHAGTLDPAAEGVLLICLGNATRTVEYLMDLHKEYRAVAKFGAETDSEDATGIVTAEYDCSSVTLEDIKAVLPQFTGHIMQIPPMVSAVHHNGKRLYELARAGETVERDARPVEIYSLSLLDFKPGDKAEAVLDIECSRGTYIRTLCADIGKTLGCGGYMAELQRTAIGRFRIEDSISAEEAIEAHTQGRLEDLIIPIDDALSEMPYVEVSESDIDKVINGVNIPESRLIPSAEKPKTGETVRMRSAGGQLLGIGIMISPPDEEPALKPEKVFARR